MVTRFAPFNEPDFEYMESFLEDMAGEGLILDHYGMWYAYFYEGEPRRRRYRIVPKIQRAVNEDEIDLYEVAGWQYAGKKFGTGLNIFYTDDPDAPELFTDMASFRMYAKRYAFAGTIAILCMLLLLFQAFDSAGHMLTFGGVLHMIGDMGVLLIAAFVLMLLLLVAIVESFVLSEFSTMYRILAAKPIRHNIEYKSKLRFHKITVVAALAMVAIVMIGQGNIGYDTTSEAKIKAYDGTHPASYEIVDPEGWSKIENSISRNDWPEGLSFGVFTKSGPLFHEKIEVHTDIDDNTYMRAIYGEAKSENIAEKWLEEEILYDTEEKLQPEEVALDTPIGLDYLGFYIDEWDDQIIYMRNGNVVERICYLGDKDLMQYIDELVEDVNL